MCVSIIITVLLVPVSAQRLLTRPQQQHSPSSQAPRQPSKGHHDNTPSTVLYRLIIVVALLAGVNVVFIIQSHLTAMSFNGVANIKPEMSIFGEFSDPGYQELVCLPHVCHHSHSQLEFTSLRLLCLIDFSQCPVPIICHIRQDGTVCFPHFLLY